MIVGKNFSCRFLHIAIRINENFSGVSIFSIFSYTSSFEFEPAEYYEEKNVQWKKQ